MAPLLRRVAACLLTFSSFFLSIAHALPPTPRQASSLPTPTTLFKIPFSGAWIENLGVKSSDGQVILTVMDRGELWIVDPNAPANGSLLFKFPAPLTATSGITEYDVDKFAVIAGQMDMRSGAIVDGSWEIWKVDLSKEPATFDKVMGFASSGFLNGIAALNKEVVLVADSGKGAVYSVNMASGAWSTAAQDMEAMGPPSGQTVGIDGVQVKDGWAYFTNILKSTVGKYPMDTTGHITGDIEIIQRDLQGDDFTFGPDGAIYLGTNFGNTIVRFGTDGRDTPVTVANVQFSAACQFGKTPEDKSVLYVAAGASGSLVAVNLG